MFSFFLGDFVQVIHPAQILSALPLKIVLSAQVAQARNMSIGIVAQHSTYKDLYGKKTCRFRNPRKWKDFTKKNCLPYLKCVLRLSCVVHGPIYGRYGFLCKQFSLYIKVSRKPFT